VGLDMGRVRVRDRNHVSRPNMPNNVFVVTILFKTKRNSDPSGDVMICDWCPEEDNSEIKKAWSKTHFHAFSIP